MMKILVTGGAGFIGSNFVCEALQQGHCIINVDRLSYAGRLSNLEKFQDHVNHHFYQEDICNGEAIAKILAIHQPDVILHMAAESHVDRSIDCADEFVRTNVVGTHRLLSEALKYYRVLNNKKEFRFIHLSTDEVFGTLGATGQFNEKMPYRPNSPYAASKASSDLLVRSYHKTYKFPTIIVNCSNNYGPKQYPEKLIPLTILNAIELKPLPVYGDGMQVRDWIYVQDHVNALFSIINRGIIGESYCIGSSNESTNLNIVLGICAHLDMLLPQKKSYKHLISFVSDRPGHDFRYATDCSKFMFHTGWKPKISLQEGLYHTIKWYMDPSNGILTAPEARTRIGIVELS